jgi:hypothetical protein
VPLVSVEQREHRHLAPFASMLDEAVSKGY